jgi:hypothetical protein
MAVDKKISQLASGAPAQAGDEYVVARSGANYKLTLTNIAASMPATTITSGNLTFSSTAQRITGDMSNATLSNRLAFQTSTTNGNTIVGAFPNGTGLNARLQAFSASDPTNASTISFEANGAISQSAITADKTGTGTYLPMTFYTGGSERVRIDTSGNVGIGATPAGTNKLTVNGDQVLLANGSIKFADSANSQVSVIKNSGGAAVSQLEFLTGSTPTERMRIDSSGNVGIGGTANASDRVTLAGTFPSSGGNTLGYAIRATIPSTTTGQYLGFSSLLYTQAASFTLGTAKYFNAQQVTIGSGSAITTQYGYFADSSLTGATNNYGFYSDIASGSNRWNFYAAGTANNYFAGDVGIGRTPVYRLHVQGSTTTSANYALVVENAGAAANLFYVRNDGLMMIGNAANSPYSYTTGNAANLYVDAGGLVYRSTSSLRYKSDVTDATHGLADVLKLRSVTYKAKNSGDTVFGGLIAEEVHDAGLTEFVAYDKEGRPDAIHYGNMVALLVKAVQELTARVAELEAK